MAGVNKVTLLGRLGKDPEVRNFQNGGKVVNLRLATSERYKDREGTQQERTEWHAVSIFNERLADVAEKYLKKGSEVYIEGAIETRKWTDNSGQEKYSTEIVLRQFRGELQLVGARPSSSSDDGESSHQGERRGGSEGRSGSGGGRSTGGTARQSGGQKTGGNWDAPKGSGDDLNDEVPF